MDRFYDGIFHNFTTDIMSKPIKHINCLNCGRPLQGEENFCPYCGQKNDVRPLSIGLYFSNFLSNFFNFDGRIWHTLFRLLKKPGQVSVDYISGKRVRYINPFRFLLQISIFYFLLNGMLNFLISDGKPDNFIKITEAENQPVLDLHKPVLDSINQVWHFTKKLKDDKLPDSYKDSIINEILKNEKIRIRFDNGKFINESVAWSNLQSYLKNHGVFYEYYPKITHPYKFEKKDFTDKIGIISKKISNETYENLTEQETINKLGIKNNFSNRLAVKITHRTYMLIKDSKTREKVKNNVISKISLALFFTLPILALFFQLIYWRKHTYTETLILIFYMQSVYFIVLFGDLLLSYLLPNVMYYLISILLQVLFAYYLYKATKRFYSLKTGANVLITSLLIVPFYVLLSSLGLLSIFALSMLL